MTYPQPPGGPPPAQYPQHYPPQQPPGGYGQPPGPPAGAPVDPQLQKQVSLWFGLSIASIFLGCGLFGIIPILTASGAKSALARGDAEGARSKIKISKALCIVGYVLAGLAIIGSIASAAMSGGDDATSSDVSATLPETPAAAESEPAQPEALEVKAATGIFSGTYDLVSGGSADRVEIKQTGETYALRWKKSNGVTLHRGVGLELTGDKLAVGRTKTKDHGIGVYTIDGGTLKGKWAEGATKGQLGSETLVGPADFKGQFATTDTYSPTLNGPYAATVDTTPLGEVYKLKWTILKNNATYRGVGFKHGQNFIEAHGTGDAAAMLFEKKDDKLVGKWASSSKTVLDEQVLQEK